MSFETELHVPGEASFVTLVRAFVDDAVGRAQLPPERESLPDAAELCFRLVLDNALAGASSPVRVVARCRPHALDISIIERGLPLDDAFAHRDPRWTDILTHVDEAHWIQRGVTGSELRLTAYRNAVAGAHAPEASDVEPPAEAPRAPVQEYTIRPYVAEDGPGVARCFFESWGYHYPVKAMYAPARLTALNTNRAFRSFVAAGADGEIAGHYGLRPHPDAPLAEGGSAVILPAHRGRSLMERLRAFAEAAAPGLGFAALYFEPVTDHVFTQRANESDGAHLCGVSLGISPAGEVQPGMVLSTTAQRQSLMLYLKALGAAEPRTLYPPARHRAMIERIYQGLGIPITFADGSAPQNEGSMRVSVNAAKQSGQISIDAIGPDTTIAAVQAYRDLLSIRHSSAVYVELPLLDPATPQLCEAFEAAGCSFAGVGPWMLAGKDALRLQHVVTPLDASKLSVFSAFGRELLAYVEAERQRVAAH